MKIYKVGGYVRDLILGIQSSDNDYTIFDANEKDLKKQFPYLTKVGSKKPVYVTKNKEYTISDFPDIISDLNSRDLTINAVAMDENSKIIFHPKAQSDFKNKILRPVSIKNFFDDPLRVFRAARFAAYFPKFEVSEELKQAMTLTAEKNLTKNISPERIAKEVQKAFASEKPGRFIQLLSSTNNLYPWFKEFENAHQIPAGPFKYHGNNSVLDHTIECMEKTAGSPLLVWMAFCHDIGKNKTPKDILPSHYCHEKTGKELAFNLGTRLKLPKKFITAGSMCAELHMKAGIYDTLKPSTKVKLLLQAHSKNIVKEIFLMAKADKGNDFRLQANQDLKKILKVKLPKDKQNLGEKSGQILFQIQCEAIRKNL